MTEDAPINSFRTIQGSSAKVDITCVSSKMTRFGKGKQILDSNALIIKWMPNIYLMEIASQMLMSDMQNNTSITLSTALTIYNLKQRIWDALQT